jgi:hypothetical protein
MTASVRLKAKAASAATAFGSSHREMIDPVVAQTHVPIT